MQRPAIIALAALTACAKTEPVTETPENDVDPTVVLRNESEGSLSANESGNLAEGSTAEPATEQWFAKTNPNGPWAGYGPPNSEAMFSVRCEDKRLVFSRAGLPSSGSGSTQMKLSIDGVDQTLSAEASDEAIPNTEASAVASSKWTERLAVPRGNLSVRIGDGDALVVPLAEPFTSVIRDCRR